MVNWSRADEILIREWKAGASRAVIAEMIGCSELAIQVRASNLRRMGVELSDGRRRDPNADSRPLTEVEEIVAREWRAGTETVKIAELVGLTFRVIWAMVADLRRRGHDVPLRQPKYHPIASMRPQSVCLAGRAADAEDGDEDAPKETAADRKFNIEIRPWAPVGPPPKTCQWLHGEPRERHFCGATVKPGSSYCPEHHARCWHKPHGGSHGH